MERRENHVSLYTKPRSSWVCVLRVFPVPSVQGIFFVDRESLERALHVLVVAFGREGDLSKKRRKKLKQELVSSELW